MTILTVVLKFGLSSAATTLMGPRLKHAELIFADGFRPGIAAEASRFFCAESMICARWARVTFDSPFHRPRCVALAKRG